VAVAKFQSKPARSTDEPQDVLAKKRYGYRMIPLIPLVHHHLLHENIGGSNFILRHIHMKAKLQIDGCVMLCPQMLDVPVIQNHSIC
jgi:hypothetical protein